MGVVVVKINWKQKLTSRKLWMGIAGVISGLCLIITADENTSQMVSGVVLELGSVVAYIIGEGLVDSNNVK